jgi:hypothetical protein
MTLTADPLRRVLILAATALLWLVSAADAVAQTPVTAVVNVSASFAQRVKVTFDRTSVTFNTQAYDVNTVVPVQAAPLTVSAKARVPPNQRMVMTVQADGPFVSGASTIPANKLTWTMTGAGFQAGGTANPNAARMLGSWRGSGNYTGTQVYEFLDSWNYSVGTYTLTMTYTVTLP